MFLLRSFVVLSLAIVINARRTQTVVNSDSSEEEQLDQIEVFNLASYRNRPPNREAEELTGRELARYINQHTDLWTVNNN